MNRKEQKNASQRRRRNMLRLKAVEYLSTHPCVVCGETDPIVLEFDHIDRSEKTSEISRMINDRKSWSDIELEIKKCQILCCNCHRRKTYIDLGWWIPQKYS